MFSLAKSFNACYIIWYFRARIKDLEGQGHFQKGHFRLRRALWLSKKAPRPSKKRHKGQKRKKGSKFKGGGGGGVGGGLRHIFFTTSKEIPPKKQKKKKKKKSSQTAQLSSLRSTQCKTHCNANGMRCDLHRHEITSINDKKKKKKLTLMFQNVQCFAHFVMFVRKFRTFTVFLRWIRRRKSQKISPRYDCDS